MIITSIENHKIKELVKLKDTKNIKKNKKYLVDGAHLVEESIKNNVAEEIFICDTYNKTLNFDITNIKINYINEKVAKFISDTEHTQGIFAICNIIDNMFNVSNYKNILILDRIQDPGNLGTIIRTADAFGFDCILIGKGSANMYNQKVIRSMQGSNFHIDCFDNIDIINILQQFDDFDIFATSLDGKAMLNEINMRKPKVAVILGNEANGISEEVLKKINNPIKIKMTGNAESLNVAIASGIIMHHLQNI